MWGGAWDSAFLASSQRMLKPLVQDHTLRTATLGDWWGCGLLIPGGVGSAARRLQGSSFGEKVTKRNFEEGRSVI